MSAFMKIILSISLGFLIPWIGVCFVLWDFVDLSELTTADRSAFLLLWWFLSTILALILLLGVRE